MIWTTEKLLNPGYEGLELKEPMTVQKLYEQLKLAVEADLGEALIEIRDVQTANWAGKVQFIPPCMAMDQRLESYKTRKRSGCGTGCTGKPWVSLSLTASMIQTPAQRATPIRKCPANGTLRAFRSLETLH